MKTFRVVSATRAQDDRLNFVDSVRVSAAASWLKGEPIIECEMTVIEALTLATALTDIARLVLTRPKGMQA